VTDFSLAAFSPSKGRLAVVLRSKGLLDLYILSYAVSTIHTVEVCLIGDCPYNVETYITFFFPIADQ
jgi:hypothetical protein